MPLSYTSTLAYINSFIDYSKTHADNIAAENFDLTRVHTLMASLGDPHRTYPVIHIAGTKGKGSVAALCAAALQSAGYRTGLYTSPHLQEYTERFQINRVPISQDGFAALVEDIQPHVEAIPRITSFEIEAALAFLYFARQNVTAAVIEVGMGGRLDATNVVDPLVSLITTISLDHVPVLGTTISEIAGEKAGIIKEGRPLVIAPQPGSAREVIQRIARQRRVSFIQVGEEVAFIPHSAGLAGQRFQVVFRNEAPVDLEIRLLGRHQVENAATAFAALRVANDQGLSITLDAIRNGFVAATWPGRFEIFNQDIDGKGAIPIILDAAHNQDSACRLRQTLDQYFPSQPIVLIFGVSGDKNVHAMLKELLPRSQTLITTQSTHPRAMPPDQLAAIAHDAIREIEITHSIQDALSRARSVVTPNGIILITGSIFLVGEARTSLSSSSQSKNGW